MKTIAFVLGLLIIAAGMVGIVAPSALLWIARHVVTAVELYIIAVVRVAAGVLLLAVASASRAPRTLRVLGAVTVIAGVITPFLGVARVQAIADWVSQQGSGVVRLTGLVALAIGGLVTHACAPAPRPRDS